MYALASAALLLFFTSVKAASAPQCATICAQSSAFALTDPNSLLELCGPVYRTATSICEVAVCNDADRRAADALDENRCGSLYRSNATLASAVSSAIASATPIAIEASSGKDPTDISNWPQCAQSCIRNNDILQVCGSLVNRQCICNSFDALVRVSTCERNTCNPADTTRESALANKLCGDIGGILSNVNGTGGILENGTSSSNSSTSNSTSPTTPSPSPFTGKATNTLFSGATGILICLALSLFGTLFW